MLELGGNAIDAGVATGFALAVLKPQDNGIAGESPILLYSADRGEAFAVNGNGTAPRAATIATHEEARASSTGSPATGSCPRWCRRWWMRT